jgi:hypothetical protein
MNPIARMMKRYIKLPLKYALPLLFISALLLSSTTGCAELVKDTLDAIDPSYQDPEDEEDEDDGAGMEDLPIPTVTPTPVPEIIEIKPSSDVSRHETVITPESSTESLPEHVEGGV